MGQAGKPGWGEGNGRAQGRAVQRLTFIDKQRPRQPRTNACNCVAARAVPETSPAPTPSMPATCPSPPATWPCSPPYPHASPHIITDGEIATAADVTIAADSALTPGAAIDTLSTFPTVPSLPLPVIIQPCSTQFLCAERLLLLTTPPLVAVKLAVVFASSSTRAPEGHERRVAISRPGLSAHSHETPRIRCRREEFIIFNCFLLQCAERESGAREAMADAKRNRVNAGAYAHAYARGASLLVHLA